jgi:glycosidase
MSPVTVVENHDEPRAAAEFGSPYRADAAALVSFTLPGMRFLFEGQTRGYHNRLDVHLRRAASEPTVTYTQQYYKTLLQILTRDAFHSGQWEFLNVLTGNDNPITNWRLMAWKWVGSSEKILCVINYSDTPVW